MCSVCKWHYMCVCVSCSIVLILVKVVVEYCQCADDLPMLVIEVMSKLIDTLKVLQVVVTTPSCDAIIHNRCMHDCVCIYMHISCGDVCCVLFPWLRYCCCAVCQLAHVSAGVGCGGGGGSGAEDYHGQASW